MPSLTDIVGQAKRSLGLNNMSSTVKGTASASYKSAINDIRGIPNGMVRNTENKVTSGVTAAVSTGLSSARQAASEALHGNFNGALDKLTMGTSDVMGTLSSTFGLSSGSKLSKAGSDPTNSLSGALARSDPLMSFQWYCVLPDVTPIGGAPVSLPWYFVEEATPPFRVFEQRSVYSQGRNKHYPSTYSVDSLRLALYADTDTKSQQYISAWQGAIVKPFSSPEAGTQGGGFGRPKGYKKTIRIYLISPTHQQLLMLEYTECWPISVDSYTLDSGSSGRLVNHVTFSVGDVFVTLFDTSRASPMLANANMNTFGDLLAGDGFNILGNQDLNSTAGLV